MSFFGALEQEKNCTRHRRLRVLERDELPLNAQAFVFAVVLDLVLDEIVLFELEKQRSHNRSNFLVPVACRFALGLSLLQLELLLFSKRYFVVGDVLVSLRVLSVASLGVPVAVLSIPTWNLLNLKCLPFETSSRWLVAQFKLDSLGQASKFLQKKRFSAGRRRRDYSARARL